MSKFGKRSSAEDVTSGLDLSGKTAVVTGINSGIGLETGRVLSMRGAQVVGTARTIEKAEAACAGFSGKTIAIECELSDPASVAGAIARIGESVDRIDMLIANAGIMALPTLETVNGMELQFATNHLGHFQLVTGLLDKLEQGARIVMVSSSAHKQAPSGGIDFENLDGSKSYSAFRAYGRSKLANVLFANELSRRLSDRGITANSLHPGVIQTNLGRHMNPLIGMAFGIFGFWALKNVAQGAATTCYVAVHPDNEKVTGKYFSDCSQSRPLAISQSEELGKELWNFSDARVQELNSG
jgi:NAD(P)-dependent dehydrogenase (short-subunit alcohol dehydrogenase family)